MTWGWKWSSSLASFAKTNTVHSRKSIFDLKNHHHGGWFWLSRTKLSVRGFGWQSKLIPPGMVPILTHLLNARMLNENCLFQIDSQLPFTLICSVFMILNCTQMATILVITDNRLWLAPHAWQNVWVWDNKTAPGVLELQLR